MRGKYLLGFDAGTSESKGTLTDLEGHVIATSARGHQVRSPQPGFAEHDPINDWLADFTHITADLLAKAGASAEEIAGIGISTIMAAVTFVDDQCEPLRNAILYGIDTRCTSQAAKITETIGADRMTERFGTECTVDHYGPKILWVRENEPEIFGKTKHITFASGFLVARLTGNYMVDAYSAAFAIPMIGPDYYSWSDEYCGLVCDKELLPQIAESTYTIAGTVTEKAAAETGLAAGTPVIVGTTDAGAEAVSVGILEPGDTMLMYGSTVFIDTVEAPGAGIGKLDAIPFTIKGLVAGTAGMATTGSLTAWIRDTMSKDLLEAQRAGGENAYAALFREAEGIPAGSDGLVILPYFQGERQPLMDPEAKGVVFGLTLGHTRGHIVHAAFEGVGFGIDQNLSALRKKGFSIPAATAVGGGTKSPLWIQTVSNITGIPQKVPKVTIGASYGDALMAGLAIGSISKPSDIKKLIEISYEAVPDPEAAARYAELKEIYAELYLRNKDLMHRLKI